MTCPCKLRAAQAAAAQQTAARLAAQNAEQSAMQESTSVFDYSDFTPEEWAQAAGVIVASSVLCAMIGKALGHPVIGMGVGVVLGAAINWQTGCHVCHAHAAAMRESLS